MWHLDPWGEERDDVRIGQLACALETLWREHPQWDVADFVIGPRDEESDEDDGWQSADEQAEILRLMAARFGPS